MSIVGSRHSFAAALKADQIPVASIRQKMFSRASDAIVIAGSIAEGIGNFLSDVDVCVVTSRLPSLANVKNREYFLVTLAGSDADFVGRSLLGNQMRDGSVPDDTPINNVYDTLDAIGTRLDIEYVEQSRLIEDINFINEAFQAAGARYGWIPEPLPTEAMRYLHRVGSGICIENATFLESILTTETKMKLAYLLFRSSCVQYADFQDVIGATVSENWNQAIFLVRTYLLNHLKALTHLHGNTNPTPKWAPTYAENIFGKNSGIVAQFNALFRGTAATDEHCRDYVLSCLDFCDTIAQKCIIQMDTIETSYPSSQILELIKRRLTTAQVADTRVRDSLEFHSKLFNPSSLPARDFLSLEFGLARCSFEGGAVAVS
jgi:predicted nucleotidyltransferase